MKTLSPVDASVLALVAENPGISTERLESLLVDVADEYVKTVARLLTKSDDSLVNRPAAEVQAVRALRKWAERNREIHSPAEATQIGRRSRR